MSNDITDISTWLPLDGLVPGFDANKAPHSRDLAGREIVTIDADGHRCTYAFDDHSLEWTDGTASGTDAYEAFFVDTGLYFVDVHYAGRATETLSLIVDLTNGRALSVITAIGVPHRGHLERGLTAVRQSFTPSLIESMPTSGDEPAPTTALIGRRVFWVYSSVHSYEHIYLSPQWYTWHCLGGPERGLADTDVNSVYQVRPGIYVFAWREKVIPCASVTIADHRDAHAIRSHGVLFGLDESGTGQTHFTFGAHGRLLSDTLHPAGFEPSEF